MIGYDTEDKCYCLEVTYNYGVYEYNRGTGLQEIAIGVSDPAATLAKAAGQYEVVVCINTPDVLNRARLQRR